MTEHPKSRAVGFIIKTLLALAVIGAYVVYSIHQHKESSSIATPAPTGSTNTPTATSGAAGAAYKDGTYTGSGEDAFYGTIQVATTISGGKLTDVKFLQYPNDQPNSVKINTAAMPLLKQEAIAAQSSKVDTITGATQSSDAFVKSLASALSQAK